MSELAVFGGPKTRIEKFPAYRPIGAEEEKAVVEVVRSGILSQFIGAHHNDFRGGPQIRALEEEWARHFGARHAIAVNSATSGLYAAMQALALQTGDEVIVTPYSMSASAVAPLVCNAIPVFADVEPDYFCLSPESVESRITPRTKAIIVVDLFGQPHDSTAIHEIASRHGLAVVEDCAQAPDASLSGRKSGTFGDIGVFSLNYHKHIHCGEGGMVVTDDDRLAERLRLVRNHAEAVLGGRSATDDLVGMLGFNYRMTEIEASIARSQLRKLPSLVLPRQENARHLSRMLEAIPCLRPAPIRADATHVYYVLPILFDSQVAGIHRDLFIRAVQAELPLVELRETEGVRIGCGYVKPLYLQPIFQKRTVHGAGAPWSLATPKSSVSYSEGICPTAEHLHKETLITIDMIHPGMSDSDLRDIETAFRKVWEHRAELLTLKAPK